MNTPVNTKYQNVALSLIVVLLGVIAFQLAAPQASVVPVARAQVVSGQDEPPPSLISAAEQRKQILSQLHAIEGKIDAVNAALNKGISVKVTDMPEMKLPELSRFLSERDRTEKAERTGK